MDTNTKTKIKFRVDGVPEDGGIIPLFMTDDYGYIDGYVCNHYGEVYACVVVNYRIVLARLDWIEVIN